MTCPNCPPGRLCTCDVMGDESMGLGEMLLSLVFAIAWVAAFLACVLPG